MSTSLIRLYDGLIKEHTEKKWLGLYIIIFYEKLSKIFPNISQDRMKLHFNVLCKWTVPFYVWALDPP